MSQIFMDKRTFTKTNKQSKEQNISKVYLFFHIGVPRSIIKDFISSINFILNSILFHIKEI